VPETSDLGPLPQATVVPRRRHTRFSAVWIIPILAAVVALGLAIHSVLSEGPTITILFSAAQGLEAGKTFIKYKEVNIGQVTRVQLTEDFSQVQVTAKISKSAARLMVEDAKFWVVRPRITLAGVSGLGTLLAGNYIGFEAGKSDTKRRHFTGLEVPPVSPGVPGSQFLLKASDLGSLLVGSPVYYRRFPVGQLTAYELAADGATVNLKVFVNAPYDKYVGPGTRFWNASGIDVSAGANGVTIRTESLEALLAGGLAFDTPAFVARAAPAPPNTLFTLYADQATAMKQPDPLARRYVLYFNESVRGLAVGAPVTFFGVPVGEVTEVGLEVNSRTLDARPRVSFNLFPERAIARVAANEAAAVESLAEAPEQVRHAYLQRQVEERGLRAQLRSGSLLTGQLYVALAYFPNAPKAKVVWNSQAPVLPVAPSTVKDVEEKLVGILAKLDKLPLEAIGNDLRNDLQALHQTLDNASGLLNHASSELSPELKKTLADVDKTLVGPDAPVQQELRDALQELARAARSLRDLTEYLQRQPQSLIRGKSAPSQGSP
jgi:paraquat-inducible protein B